MNLWLIFSGIFAIITGIVHGFLGERRLIGPLLSIENPSGVLKSEVSRNVLRGIWHLPAISWALMGLMTIYYSFSPNPPAIPILFAVAIYTTAMLANIIATKGKSVGWPLLFIISLLALIGLYT